MAYCGRCGYPVSYEDNMPKPISGPKGFSYVHHTCINPGLIFPAVWIEEWALELKVNISDLL